MSQSGLPIAVLQYFNIWTLVISLRRRKCPNKGIDWVAGREESNLTGFSKVEGIGEKGKACQSYVLRVD